MCNGFTDVLQEKWKWQIWAWWVEWYTFAFLFKRNIHMVFFLFFRWIHIFSRSFVILLVPLALQLLLRSLAIVIVVVVIFWKRTNAGSEADAIWPFCANQAQWFNNGLYIYKWLWLVNVYINTIIQRVWSVRLKWHRYVMLRPTNNHVHDPFNWIVIFHMPRCDAMRLTKLDRNETVKYQMWVFSLSMQFYSSIDFDLPAEQIYRIWSYEWISYSN